MVVRGIKYVTIKLTESLINAAAVMVKNDRSNVSPDEWFMKLKSIKAPSSSRIKQSKKISSLCIIPEDEGTVVL